MGNKTNPNALRLGYIHDWQSKWFSIKDAPTLIGEDFKIRNLVRKTFKAAAVSWVGIERTGTFLRVFIHTARPGVVIGKKGADIELLRKQVEAISQRQTRVNVVEIKDPELDSRLVAESIAVQLEKRIAHRRAMRRAMERTLQSGALGIKVMVSGRINGAEISRREWNREGRVPLHTYAADVDYGTAEAMTSAGLIGVKVWIFKKQHFVKSFKELQQMAKKEAALAAAAMAVESGSASGAAPAAPDALVEGAK
ncbi:MAG: 30S ribosomal protein S3 [Elusimicrobia bacterium]|nr:30S ribosomal protein S3 [Elusimicrobiota bacterium]